MFDPPCRQPTTRSPSDIDQDAARVARLAATVSRLFGPELYAEFDGHYYRVTARGGENCE